MTAITDDCAAAFGAGPITVGVTAVQLSATQRPLTRGVQLRADLSNTGTIYIDNSSGVTADSTASGGYALAAGETIFIGVNDLSAVWLIASAASQLVQYLWL